LNAAGDINIELSHAVFEDLFYRGLLADATWSTGATTGAQTDISAANADNSFNSVGADFTGFTVGEWIIVSGFTGDTSNNGIFKILTMTTSKLTVSGGTLVDDAAGESVTITELDSITNGKTLATFSIEKHFTDLTNIYEILTGLAIESFGITVPTDGIVTGSFSFLGKNAASGAASAGSGYTTAATNDVMSSIDDVDAIIENAAAFASTSFSFSITNNLRARQQIGTLGAISIGTGVLNVTGTLQAYFATSAIIDKFLNQTITSLALTMQDDSGNAYVFEFPQVRFTSAQRVAGGQNQDIIADLAWSAYMDTSEGITVRIAKT
jgi:hypothetical protein